MRHGRVYPKWVLTRPARACVRTAIRAAPRRQRRAALHSTTVEIVTANRDELINLVEGLPDDQVEVLLADARRLVTRDEPKASWPPKFVGMIKDGPTNGSSPEHIDAVLSRGFGSER